MKPIMTHVNRMFGRLRIHVQRLLTQPTSELSRAQRTLRYLADLGRHCGRELVYDRAGTMAAALTFHTMFSLLPTLALMLVVLQAFVTDNQLEQLKLSTTDYVLKWLDAAEEAAQNIEEGKTADAGASAATQPSTARPAPPPDARPPQQNPMTRSVARLQQMLRLGDAGPPGPGDAAEMDGEAEQRRQELNRTAAAVRSNVQQWLDQLENISFSRIGAVGVLLFIYAATNLLGTIEGSFNRIFNAPAGRRWYIRLPMYYTIITLGPLVILAGQFFQGQFVGLLEATAGTQAFLGGVGRFFAATMSVISPVITSWLVLLSLYMLLPNTRVRFKSAAIGALVSAVAWVGLIELFGLYVRNAAAATLYGAMALLPIFLMWLWLTWLIILFGLELAYALQNVRGGRFKSIEYNPEEANVVDPRWLIPLMTLIGQRFEEGKSTSLEEVCRSLTLPVRAVRRLTETLHEAGLLHRTDVDTARRDDTWVLARPPAMITVSQLLDLGDQLSLRRGPAATLPGDAVLERLQQTQRQAADGQTLEDVLRRR